MPIKPENQNRYPDNWKEISQRIKERANWTCEQCGAVHGEINPNNGKATIITTAHLNHIESDCRDENLAALCRVCHLRYDASHHAKNARLTRIRNKKIYQQSIGQLSLWSDES